MLESKINSTPSEPKIALALSGGGSRAMAFHLGCLRALNQLGLLERVSIISSVSGGSVVAALYCSHPGSFSDFERKAREVLARGFVRDALRVALTTTEGMKALFCVLPLSVDRAAALLTRYFLKSVGAKPQGRWFRETPFRRSASRTTILRRAFADVFDNRKLNDLRTDRPKLVIIACELRSKAAFYFTAEKLHCWRYGSADASDFTIADAVAASASYPVALPALDERIVFEQDGRVTEHRVMLTDRGVYDNLALAPFWPDRDSRISLEVGTYDHVIACRAGYALEIADPAAFMPSRMIAAFESVHARAQNLATTRLFELQRAGRFRQVLLPYLGQDDRRLARAPSDLVPVHAVAGYPTDFSAMTTEWIDRLSKRGEQLVLALLEEHWSLAGDTVTSNR